MLNIHFGISPNKVIISTREYFNHKLSHDCLTTDFAKDIIRKIDNSEVLSNRAIDSPVLGIVPPDSISGGAKALLIAMFKEDDGKYLMLEQMGENCYPFLYDIAKRKDILLYTEMIPVFDYSDGLEVCIENLGIIIRSGEEILDAYDACEYDLNERYRH